MSNDIYKFSKTELDEQGSWTPVLGGSGGTSGQTYGAQVGRYVKAGKLVTVFGRITLTAKGTITGNAEIQGLPFPVENIANIYGVCEFGYFANLTTALVAISGTLVFNTSAISLFGQTAAATSRTQLTGADFSNTTDIIFSAHYRTT